MAVKASESVTITKVKDIASVWLYYWVQQSSLATPVIDDVTKRPPKTGGIEWSDAEPGYSLQSSKSLYTVECTVFSDGSISYSSVCKSSSYEAAKEAYNLADAARTAASSAQSSAIAASQAAGSAQTSANQALADAATANTAANNAGRAAAIAQAAAEEVSDEVDELETYFWHDSQGAHVLGDTYRTDVKDGLKVVKNSDGNVLADFNVDGLLVKNGSGVEIAHLGYGYAKDQSGSTSNKYPYTSLSKRANGYVVGAYSTGEGNNPVASGFCSHSEGYQTEATGQSAHAEGSICYARGSESHAEGSGCNATGSYSHAEGSETDAVGIASHAENEYAEANCKGSHAEGYHTEANANYSHAEGGYTDTYGVYQHVQGRYNVTMGDDWADVVGNGEDGALSNASALDWDGNLHLKGTLKVGCNANSTGGTSLLDFCHPVGTVYMTEDANFNPNTAWGGTWDKTTYAGRVVVGVDANNTLFNAAGKTGGTANAVVPYHRHQPSSTGKNFVIASSAAGHKVASGSSTSYYYLHSSSSDSGASTNYTSYAGTSGNATNANYQPYRTAYVWLRTA